MKGFFSRILIPFFLLCGTGSYAQDSTLLRTGVTDTLAMMRVADVIIAGNSRTKDYIILREMRAKKGDSIPAGRIQSVLELSRQLINNTNLFSEVHLYPIFVNGRELNIYVMVKERWYIYPAPQFRLVDRNINEWINEHNASLDRVTYGLKFDYYNFTGRADHLRLYLLNGFSRLITVGYLRPFSNRKLTEGYSASVTYVQTREVAYKTNTDNGLMRYGNNGFVRKEVILRGSYLIRKGFYRKHNITGGFWHYTVNDSILNPKYNPAYLNNGRSEANFPYLAYQFSYINTNNINYPLQGKIYSFGVLKKGFGYSGGINMLRFDGQYNIFSDYGRQWYGAFSALGMLRLPLRTAYINQRALGYEEFYLRGLENYVIDGYAAAVLKYSLRKKLFSFKIPLPWNVRQFPYIPFSFYAKTYADLGWSQITPELITRLNNKLLYSAGIGIDMITVYDFNFKVEYSFNQLGEKGIFLHTKTNF